MTPIIPERELTTEEQAIIGQMRVETLRGEIKQETWDAVHMLDLENMPGPYRHMI